MNYNGVTVNFDIEAYALLDGQPMELGLVFASAETDDGTNEHTKGTTNGTPWKLIEGTVKNNTAHRTIEFSNECRTASMKMAFGNVALLYTSKLNTSASAPLIGSMELIGGGKGALALGIVINQDLGDAPLSYGTPANTFFTSVDGGLNNPPILTGSDPLKVGLSDGVNGATPIITEAVLTAPQSPRIGTNPTDADSQGRYSENADGDDTSGSDDEDGFNGDLPPVESFTYTLQVPAFKSTSTPNAYIIGWIDFNKDGKFQANERAIGTLTASGALTNVPLTWTVPTNVSVGKTYVRLRISHTDPSTLVDNPNTDVDELSTMNLSGGETEDYVSYLKVYPRVEKSVSNSTPIVGEEIIFTLRAYNDGVIGVNNVKIVDPLPAGLQFVSATPSKGTWNNSTGTWQIGTLAAGAEETLLLQVKVLTQPQKTNIAGLTTPDWGNEDPITDEAIVTPIAENPNIRLIKEGVLKGDNNTIEYTFTVINTGNIVLNNIQIEDANLNPSTIIVPGTLAPNDSLVVKAKYTITLTDRNVGKVENTAIVKGTSPIGTQVSDTSGTDQNNDEKSVVNITPAPSIDLVKTASLSQDQNTVTYTFVVKNTGNVTLSNLQIEDAKLTPSTITIPGTLQPNDTVSTTATYTVTQAEKNAGVVKNQAIASGTPPNSNTSVTDISGTTEGGNDSTMVTLIANPGISLVKTARLSEDHTTVTYTFIVKNTGDVTLEHIQIEDEKLSPSIITLPGKLYPNDTLSTTAIYTLTQADKSLAKVINTAVVTAKDPQDRTVTDISGTDVGNDTATELDLPSIALVKTGIVNNDAGIITYTFVVTNTGKLPLSNVHVIDSKLTPAKVTLAASTLLPGESTTGTAIYAITEADRANRQVSNTAKAFGTPPSGLAVEDISSTLNDNDDPTITPVPACPTGVKCLDVQIRKIK